MNKNSVVEELCKHNNNTLPVLSDKSSRKDFDYWLIIPSRFVASPPFYGPVEGCLLLLFSLADTKESSLALYSGPQGHSRSCLFFWLCLGLSVSS
jgi:hypothetical protein